MGNDLGIDLKRLQRINPLLERFIGEGNQLPGAQTLLWRRGELVDFQSAGFRDRENRLPVEEDTIFRIYSMTKPLISAAMMMLFEEGHFQLFSPVSEFIPGFRNLQVFQKEDPQTVEWITEKMEHPVTFHELLTHTSGLTYGLQAAHHPVARRYNEMNLEGDSFSLEQVVDKILEQPLAFQPGSHWHYSASTDVLARVVEVISGKSIDA
ncbi:MAG TPA: serine hydrolase domain-containing protein, partial [SAR324 cluster bacterium]|nr:serine hydrolase domain-containing protein [SAR324 cluster bacterium]